MTNLELLKNFHWDKYIIAFDLQKKYKWSTKNQRELFIQKEIQDLKSKIETNTLKADIVNTLKKYQKTVTVSTTTKATFEGFCSETHEKINIGDLIEKTNTGWIKL